MEAALLGNRVTVRYTNNVTEPLPLTFVSRNGRALTVTLDGVTNIDKVPPVVEAGGVTLSPNGRQASFTLTADETVTFREGGSQGRKFTRTVTQNGSYLYHFTDKAGNEATVTVPVNAIVSEPLTLSFHTEASDTGAVSDVSTLALEVGDTLYVKASRPCAISFNGGPEEPFTGDWLSFPITEDAAGLYPYVKATDSYGNTAHGQLTQIKPVDRTPPTLRLNRHTLVLPFATDEDAIRARLLANLTVSDNQSAAGAILREVVFAMPQAPGTVAVTYSATDEKGNKATATGYLRLYGEQDLQVTVNGGQTFDGELLTVTGGAQAIGVVSGGDAYSIVWKTGIKTVAQMKTGAQELVRGSTEDGVTSFSTPKAGYYTLLITTQSRASCLVTLYVK